tara:strand:- start:3065 stop:3796 length:732 start_codon:yes stop_codon:yes gene_type:complete
MAKSFTQIPTNDLQAAKPENLNDNLDKYLSEFNGNLDGHNNPVETIREQHFILPNEGAFSDVSGDVLQLGTSYATQAYFKTRRSSSFETASNVFSPLLEINLDQDSWSKGFNILTQFTGFEDFPLVFEAKEGMLVGCATIDWEHGTQVFNPGGNVGIKSRGFNWWTEWGVFVNNVLVARSGQIYPRRHTTQIPFAVACGSQQVTVDVRFITITNRTQNSPNFTTDSSNFNLFSAEIWCRNSYR